MSFIKAKEYLKQFSQEDKVMEFSVPSATVELAAENIFYPQPEKHSHSIDIKNIYSYVPDIKVNL